MTDMAVPAPDKLITADALAPLLARARAEGRQVVWTNGCFDLFHAGHVLSLEAARAMGDILVVGLNSDRSVRELKGPARPIIPQAERARVLGALSCVDHIVLFDGKRCTRELELLRPDVYAQGGSYTLETIDQDERRAVEEAGGRCAFLPMMGGLSSSMILKRIRRSDPEKIVSAAFAIIRDEVGRLLMVANKYIEGVRWGLPGGGHIRGEQLETTIIREVKEEVGLDVVIKRYRGVIERWEPTIDLHLVLHLFEARVVGGTLMQDNSSESIVKVDWFDLAKLESHPEWILGREVFAHYLRDPEGFPYYTHMGPGEE